MDFVNRESFRRLLAQPFGRLRRERVCDDQDRRRSVENLGGKQFDPEKLLAQGSARLEVQRGKRRFFITASLK